MPAWRRREDGERSPGESTKDWELDDVFDDPFFDMQSDQLRAFDDQFRRMQTYLDAMMEKAGSAGLRGPVEGGPFVFGWSMRVGPDGVPHVRTFGNVRPQAMRGEPGLPKMTGTNGPRDVAARRIEGPVSREQGTGDDDGTEAYCERELVTSPCVREPLTDVCESENDITITAGMPGIEMDHIELETGDDFLVVRVEKGDQKFYKEIPLHTKIMPDSARARYNNGVLEITVEKAASDKRWKNVKGEWGKNKAP